MNPVSKEKVLDASDVLKPWKRMREAMMVQDEKPT